MNLEYLIGRDMTTFNPDQYPPSFDRPSPPPLPKTPPQKNLQGPFPEAETTASPSIGNKVFSLIDEQSALFSSSRAITELSKKEALIPISEHTDSDIYITKFDPLLGIKDVVFKPGLIPAQLAELCKGIVDLIGLSHIIAPTKKGVATVIAGEDLEIVEQADFQPKLKEYRKISIDTKSLILDSQDLKQLKGINKFGTNFELLSSGEEENIDYFLAPKDQIYEIFEKNGQEFTKIRDYIYEIKALDEQGFSFKLTAFPERNKGKQPENSLLTSTYSKLDQQDPEETDSLIEVLVPDEAHFDFSDHEDIFEKISLVLKDKIPSAQKNKDEVHSPEIIAKDGNEYVMRNGQLYSLISKEQETFIVIGKDVQGMLQAKIENTFTGPLNSSGSVDITTDTTRRRDFFNRIEMNSFIESFLVTILLRPEDGKIKDLTESNVLFVPIPGKDGKVDVQTSLLRPVLIDFDETLPKQNDWQAEGIHAVRCGLMGFPQAELKLSSEQRAFALQHLNNIINQKGQIKLFLEKSLPKANVEATLQIIERMQTFMLQNQENEWSLEDLFFHVFPEYKQQWMLPEIKTESRSVKADIIGWLSENGLKSFREGNDPSRLK